MGRLEGEAHVECLAEVLVTLAANVKHKNVKKKMCLWAHAGVLHKILAAVRKLQGLLAHV